MTTATLLPCRACGNDPITDTFEAASNSFLGRVRWTRIECRGHPYVSVQVDGESHAEAAAVWNGIMGEKPAPE